jgi:hypothetical protein
MLEEEYDKDHRARYIEEGKVTKIVKKITLILVHEVCKTNKHFYMSLLSILHLYVPLLRQTNLLPIVEIVHRGMPVFNVTTITAMVDRWRPDTHSFHLPCDEMTSDP